jgi:hypothetical protein
MQSYAQTPEEIATLLREQGSTQVSAIYSDSKVQALSVDQKLELLKKYTWRHIVMADLALANNFDALIPMPYAQWSCPQAPVELTRSSIQIGGLNQDDIYELIQVSIKLIDLSNGLMCAPETSDWPIYALSQDPTQFRKYQELQKKMGPLAQMYLEIREHSDIAILPDILSNASTLAYPTDMRIRDADGNLNPKFFETWWSRIQARFTTDTAVTQALGGIMQVLPPKEATDDILNNLQKGQLSDQTQCEIVFALLSRLTAQREFLSSHFAPISL